MAKDHQPTTAIECCPPMEKDATCDVLDFHYRLRSDVTVGVANRRLCRQK